MFTLFRDYETRGTIDLRRSGAWKYAGHVGTEMLCCAYAVDDGPVKLWKRGDPVPAEFVEAARNKQWIAVAHNAAFEMAIERLVLHRRYGWPIIPLRRNRCSMAAALACSLPADLGLLAEALGLIHQKDKAGHRLMLMLSKPRRPRQSEDPEKVYWFEDQDRCARLFEYCIQDVEVEREAYKQIRPLSTREQQLWELDQAINVRGIPIDHKLAKAAYKVACAAAP